MTAATAAPCLLPDRRRVRPVRDAARDAAATAAAFRAVFDLAAELDPPTGTVYLICADRPYVAVTGHRRKTVRHYLGFTGKADFGIRIAQHLAGTGARLIEVITAAGIGITVARVWLEAPQAWERKLKRRGHANLLCPRCSGPAALRRGIPPAWARPAAHGAAKGRDAS